VAALLAASLAALGIAIWGGSASAHSASAASAPVSGGTLIYGADREPTCLDPHNDGDMPQTYVARQYLDSLVSELPDGQVVPWLATSWKISNGGRTYTFQIKQGVKFTDGTPLNAQAVVANFTQELNPATQDGTDWGYLYPYYVNSKATGPYTVQLNLKQSYAPLLDALAQAFFGIESPKAMARGLKVNCQSPVGTGPFVVKNWIHGQQITLVRNPNYDSWPANAKHKGPAYLSGITWRFLEEASTRYSALTSGEAQIIFNIPPEDQTAAQSNSSLSVQQFVHSGQPNNLTLNSSQFPFTDINVRKAFIYGADIASAVKSAFFGAYPAETTDLSTGTPDYDAALASQYNYNPSEANKLLNASGWTKRNAQGYRVKGGKVLGATMVYSSNTGDTPPELVTLFQDIQAAEKQIGFQLILKPIAESALYAFFGKWDPTGYQIMGDAYWNSPTPEVLYIVDSPTTPKVPNFNNGQYATNPALNKILLEATATTNTALQKKLYDEAQVMSANEAWAAFLYPVTTDLGISTKLHNVWIEPSEGEPVLSDAWLSK
jgi:peptide/nickel transport system substrate-binding protein